MIGRRRRTQRNTPFARQLRRAVLAFAVAAVAGPVLAQHAGGTGGAATPRPLVLDTVTVVGSRTREPDLAELTTARVYDREFIAATGALRLADFLNQLPQNYTGGSAGRGSAPNDANPEFGVKTETSSPLFNFVLGAASVPLPQSGVSGANLRGLGSASTLVLIDGRRQPIAGQGNLSTDMQTGFVDLNAIPLGMIERVEVLADGASAIYGSDAIGGVINVVLKKDYRGAEVTATYRGAFDGGGRERRATLAAGGATRDGRLRGTLMLDVYDRAKLSAAQRPFSAEQDHRSRILGYSASGAPVAGRDLRLNWGYPAVVQARTGNLAAVRAPDGAPVRVVLVPEAAAATPALADFVAALTPVPPATTVNAQGQRRTNTAEFLALLSPQRSRGASGHGQFEVSPELRVYAGFGYTETAGRFDAQPPVAAAAAATGFGSFATVVPAAIEGAPNPLNPFGQDVMVGLVHHEFGPTRQSTRTTTPRAHAGLTGAAGGDWIWDAGVQGTRQRFARRDLTLNPQRFTAALAGTDPALRFNPFLDARAAGPVHAVAYAAMTQEAGFDATSELLAAHLTANGPVHPLPAGEVQLAVGAEATEARLHQEDRTATGVRTERGARRRSLAAFAEAWVPVTSPSQQRPGLRRLELQLAARYERHNSAGDTLNPKAALVWSPVEAVLLRASFARGFRAPSLTELLNEPFEERRAVQDPARGGARVDVDAIRGVRRDAEPETSRHASFGASLTPRWVEGLTLSADFFRTDQRNALQLLPPQRIVELEAWLPGRVSRAPATPEDAAQGLPGAIVAVDAAAVNFGAVRSESLDLRAGYDVPAQSWGRLRIEIAATRMLALREELNPLRTVDAAGDTAAPPRWSGLASVAWDRGPWSASAAVRYVGAFASNLQGNTLATGPVAAFTTMLVRVAHRFEGGGWRGWGEGATLSVGIGNVFDREPPFADTVFGFNGGLHAAPGRTYEVSWQMEF